jgi:hypothetical protein
VADDYSWSGLTIFSLANPSLFGYTEYTFNVTASSACTPLQFEGFSIAGVWCSTMSALTQRSGCP